MNEIRIVPIDFAHIPGFREAVGEVARERRCLLATDAFPTAQAASFVADNIANGNPHVVALQGDAVIGWCDICRHQFEGTRHRGTLGIGLRPSWRGRGLGERLASTAIGAAWQRGFERIELNVRGSNARAIGLYLRLGFETEGRMREAVRLDGIVDEMLIMGLLHADATNERTQGEPS